MNLLSRIGTGSAALAVGATLMLLAPLAHAQVASTTPPVISNVGVVASSTSAIITWQTNAAASSQVGFSTTTPDPILGYTHYTGVDNTQVTSHSVTLAGLTPLTTYHFQVLSQVASSSASSTSAIAGSSDSTFMTLMSSSTGGTGTTSSVSLTAPTNLSPSSGSSLDTSLFTTADWTDVTGANTPITYSYESSLSSTTNNDGSFTTPLFQSGALSSSQISTSGTSAGTYFWHARAMDNSGNTSSWSQTSSVTVTNNGTTTGSGGTGTTTPNLSALITALQGLQVTFPNFSGQIQGFINMLLGSGTIVGNTTGASIDQNGSSFNAGGSVDFSGRNFGHEETVTVALNGVTVATAHADGGGNFSTGSIGVPSLPGTYTYTFTGASSGTVESATITVH